MKGKKTRMQRLSLDKVMKWGNWFIILQIVYNCVIKFCIFDLGFSNIFNYITDIFTVATAALAVYAYLKTRPKQPWIIYGAAAFFCIGTISALVHKTPILLYIWSIRKNFRFILFLWSCFILLKKEYIEKLFKILFCLVIVNTIMVTYGFFFTDLNGDGINGLFGSELGGNAFMNSFLCVVVVYYLIMYLHQKKKLRYFLIILVCTNYIAAMSELKMLYIELACICAGAVILNLNKKRVKKVAISAGSILLTTFLSIQAMYILYPAFDNFFEPETVWNYSAVIPYGTGHEEPVKVYDEDGTLVNEVPVFNRVQGIKLAYQHFLKTPLDKCIGIGFGNAESGSFQFFTSDFYRVYGETKYAGFLIPFFLTETGIIGVLCYSSMFVLAFLENFYNSYKKKMENGERAFAQVTEIMAGVCLLLCFYDASLRVEATGYIVFWTLAFGYCMWGGRKNHAA